jgi:hypothetical protein
LTTTQPSRRKKDICNCFLTEQETNPQNPGIFPRRSGAVGNPVKNEVAVFRAFRVFRGENF